MSLGAELIPIGAAVFSTSGAVYVGWQQRTFTQRLASREHELAGDIARRRLIVTLGTRALLVSRYAQEARRFVREVSDTEVLITKEVMIGRTERLDAAYESFVECWAEAVSSSIHLDALPALEGLTDGIEQVRLRVAMGRGELLPLLDALATAAASADKCHEACTNAARASRGEVVR